MFYKNVIYLLPTVFLLLLFLFLIQQFLSLTVANVLVPVGGILCFWTFRREQRGRIEGTTEYNAIVVGAGFSGLCAGARFAQREVPFTIFEAASEVVIRGGRLQTHTLIGQQAQLSSSCPIRMLHLTNNNALIG